MKKKRKNKKTGVTGVKRKVKGESKKLASRKRTSSQTSVKKSQVILERRIRKSPVSKSTSLETIQEKLKDQAEFSLDSFLIDEQLNYSKQLEKEEKELQKKIKPIINDLDKLILGKRSEKSFIEILPTNQIKISLNKQGEIKRERTSQFSGSVHRVDLTASKEHKRAAPSKFKAKEVREDFDEFKIVDSKLDIPKTSLVKKEKLTKWFTSKFISLKNRLSREPQETKIAITRYFWFQRLKMALNFALIALLLILPIRALFFYQYVDTTKGQVLGISEEALTDLELGAQAASSANWQDAGMHFLSASNHFSQAKENLLIYNQTLINIARNLPATGDLINSGENLLLAGNHLTRAAGSLTTVLDQITESKDLDQTITDNLAIVNVALRDSQEEIASASNYLLEVSPKIIPEKYRDFFIQIQSKLPTFLEGLSETQKFIDFSLKVLGHHTPQRYLFLFQNNNELRATGGFLGSAALVDLKKGEIINLEVPSGGLYDLKGDFFEKIISPGPMQLLGYPWQIWDANWWPDFPTSAKKITWFWEKSGWPTVDGVIAFNSSLMPKILEIVGDIEMPDYNQLLTPETVVLALQHETEFEYSRAENRPKQIIADLMPILITKLLEIPTNQALPLLLTLNQALTEKEIQFYFVDNQLQNYVQERRWAGEILDSSRDYLFVVNQNVAGGKSDTVVNQEISHYAYLQPDGSIIDTVAITRTHYGNPEDVFEKAQNNSYIRVYVPQGSQLLEVTGYDIIDPELFKEVYQGYHQDEELLRISGQITKDAKTNTNVYNELGKTVFGNWLQVKPGESKTITFSYKLPLSLNFASNSLFKKSQSQKYSLLVQSQSGANQTTFSSHLYLTNDLNVIWSGSTVADFPEAVSDGIKFNTPLNTDHYYGVLIDKE